MGGHEPGKMTLWPEAHNIVIVAAIAAIKGLAAVIGSHEGTFRIML